MNKSPQKSAINSQIEDLIVLKYLNLNKRLQRGAAFNELSASIICNCDIQDEDIVDGNDDNGIDVIYVASNDEGRYINILNCKSSEVDNFSETDLQKIKEGLLYAFEKSISSYKKLDNKNFLAKIEDIREDKEDIQEVNCFYVVFNGGNKNSKKIEREADDIREYFSKYFQTVYPNAKFSLELISADDLFSLDVQRRQTLKNKKISLPYFGDKIISSEIETEKVKGRIATIKGEELAKLVVEYGEVLFEKNVRGWMSLRKFNKDILKSCSSDDDADLFWFLNNGLTIICEKCVPDPDKKILSLTNPQIINGQQTSRVLERAFRDKILKNGVKVLLKIYETVDADIIVKVAKATNSQLVVKSRDLVSNNPEQIAVQKEFLRYSYACERQRGEKNIKTKDVKGIFNNFFVAQSVLSVSLCQPSLAKKKQEDKIFGEPNYSKIFKNREFSEILLVTLLCLFCLNRGRLSKRISVSDDIEYFAYFHIARIIWFYFKNEYSKMDNEGLIKIIDNKDSDKILNKFYKQAVDLLYKIYKDNNKKEKIISIGHFYSRIDIENDINKELYK